jgi:hypothetical protein
MSSLTTEPKHGERRRIGDDDCVWITGHWERIATLKARLSDLVALQNYNTRMGAPALVKMNRQEIAHIRELLSEVAA